MKKLFLGLAMSAGTLSFAQEQAASSASPVRFGLKAGLNVATISSDDAKAKAGIYGGVFANIPVAGNFSLQPEVLYSGMGAKNKDNPGIRLNLDYISVPVMVQYNIYPAVFLEAGPQFSFAIDKRVKNDTRSMDATRVYNGFDFGLGLGAGYYFEQGFGVTVRYVAGLTNIIENSQGDAIRNSLFQVGIAYKF
ncbi:porin family protein [uncultured Chryseobacterium sp.]|uniref:porin family protein n=1 Tax=uncultured Chryseobacterium sp. TaxID=259322 RepID=UPI0026006434|nr:porin family protein [uncultured Chryseobacterium sp.]